MSNKDEIVSFAPRLRNRKINYGNPSENITPAVNQTDKGTTKKEKMNEEALGLARTCSSFILKGALGFDVASFSSSDLTVIYISWRLCQPE